MRRLREIALAVFVVFHLCAVLVGAVPSTRSLTSRENLRDPAVVELLDALRLGLGYDGDAAAFEDEVVQLGEATQSARQALLTPFRPYQRLTGSRQSWQMFSFLNRTPGALVIAVDGQEIYRSGQGGWHEEFWEGSRVTGLVARWSHNGPKHASFRRLAGTLQPALARDFPDGQVARFCMEHQRVVAPGGARPEPVCHAPIELDLR